MNAEAKKIRLAKIDEAFSSLKKNINDTVPLREIERYLKEIFNQTFSIKVMTNVKKSDPCFVMSVFPETSTMDKIVNSIVKEEPVNMIHEIWSKNTSWYIEIDRRILDDSIVTISPRELTALLLHEIGHVIDNNSVPTRIVNVLKYEYAQMETGVKKILNSDRFKGILSLPIMDTCTFSAKDIKREIAADKFASQLGYNAELTSVLNKFIDRFSDKETSMKNCVQLSEEIVNNFRYRKGRLNQRIFDKLLMNAPSDYIGGWIRNARSIYTEGCNDTSVTTDSMQMKITCERANDIVDSYYTEFFFSKKKLKKLSNYDIDYIAVEIDKIKSHDDKLLILSYIRSKQDTAQYYIDILNNPKYAKKYEVPHSMEYLLAYKERMDRLQMLALNKKIDENKFGFTSIYPAGYEG
jgi:hypothetical protein